jgi:ABC-type uncharacterized transport system ATPase subunit
MTDLENSLVLSNISKQYGDRFANNNISLEVVGGRITAIVGENGAGKSTLMKIIHGSISPDSGNLNWNGKILTKHSPAHARDLGIQMVYQHFSLFETLSVQDNISLALGSENLIGEPSILDRINQKCEEFGIVIDPDRLIYSLSMGERQRVELVRCLLQKVNLLILDEPTSVLTPQETKSLFGVLKRLADRGVSILFISHKLYEVKELCDQAIILRNGKVEGSFNPKKKTVVEIANLMVGEELTVPKNFEKRESETTILEVKNFYSDNSGSFSTSLKDLNFDLRAGEILGIAGISGNGQAELFNAVSGEGDQMCEGMIEFKEQDISHLSPQMRRETGVHFVPEDRLGRGAIETMSLWENSILTLAVPEIRKKFFLDKSYLNSWTKEIIEKFSVQCLGYAANAGSLSGGNLQKFIMGREILQQPEVLVVTNPTWGVDVAAAAAIHHALISLRDRGAGILVISEDIDELFKLSDRLMVICEGKLSKARSIKSTSIQEVGQQMVGANSSTTLVNEAR